MHTLVRKCKNCSEGFRAEMEVIRRLHNLNLRPSQLLDNIPNTTMVMLLVGIRMAATTGDNSPCTA